VSDATRPRWAIWIVNKRTFVTVPDTRSVLLSDVHTAKENAACWNGGLNVFRAVPWDDNAKRIFEVVSAGGAL
jgi:hypothetical protein